MVPVSIMNKIHGLVVNYGADCRYVTGKKKTNPNEKLIIGQRTSR